MPKNLKRFALSSLSNPLCKRICAVCPTSSPSVLLHPYAHDIHETDRMTEKSHFLAQQPSLTETQNEVNEHMRGVLVDWLIEVVEEFRLSHQVLLLGVDYLDRVLSVLRITKESLQLIGITCLFIASKFDGSDNNYCLDDFVSVTDGLYSRSQAIAAEQEVLGSLEFRLVTSTISTFLPGYLAIAGLENNDAKHYSKFLTEMLLPNYGICRKYLPSKIAASIVVITNRSFGSKEPLPTEFEDYTQYTEESLAECVHDIQTTVNGSEFMAAYHRYNQMKYDSISAIDSSFS